MKQKSISFLLALTFACFLAMTVNSSYGIEKKKPVNQDIYTPNPKLKPRINGPLIYGCRPAWSPVYLPHSVSG